MIIDFINSGKSVYIEGTDVASGMQGTSLFSYFGNTFDGEGGNMNVQDLAGVPGTFADPIMVDYQYFSESDYGVDELGAASAGICVQSQDMIGRVTYWDGPGGTYRAMMSSILFGSIIDGTGSNNKAALLSRYYSFMKIPPVSVDPPNSPSNDILMQNYPNPFSVSTLISYSIPTHQNSITFEIFDIRGRKIKEFSSLQQDGTIVWDGSDHFGNKVSNGVYLHKFNGNESTVHKMMYIK
ncbi:MAG TPA: T9SS type A sorting domain-containing protein [Candidatus Cloacimonetes bacterium]|nr:T9SS type A sorting domain-containing protein [Candidatus Cloacimonadota bacterium]